MKLSVIGLGKLGSCSAACFAAKGFKVVGVDINNQIINKKKNGKAPVYEPRLQEMIKLAGRRLRATQDYSEAIANSDITFLIVPTPSRQDGHFSDKYLLDALGHLCVGLKKSDKKNHLFVITSTVSPRTTKEVLIPFIENKSGRKLNKGFSICYNPEFIALGSVINDFLKPDMVLIGENDKKSGDILEKIYSQTCENSPYFARMSVVSAEVTKISLNSFVTMKISFANILTDICESLPGADIDDVTRAIGSDKRVSPYYLKGGLSYGGPCFPRDNRAFASFAKDCGIDAKLAKATDEINESQIGRIVDLIIKHLPKDNNVVAVLGLSYKLNTNVIEESPALKIIEGLLEKKDVEVIVYDAVAIHNARMHFGDRVFYASSIKECLKNASICILALPAEEFKKINLSGINRRIVIIDCWRILENKCLPSRVKYVPLGRRDE